MDEQSYATLHRLGQGHWWYRGTRSVYRALLRQYAAGLSGPVLDLGCGAGGNLEMAREWGAVIGLDAWRPALTLCPSGVAMLAQGAAETLPFDDETFGLVAALGLVEHVADDVKVLREVRRVLRPGGTALLLTSAFRFLWSRHDEANCHVRRYTARELRRKAESAGLRVRHISYLNCFLFPVAAAVRLAQRLLPRRGEPQLDMFPVPEPFNSVLAGLLALEGWLMRWMSLPFGVSLVTVLER